MPKKGRAKRRALKEEEEEEDQPLIDNTFEQSVNGGDDSVYDDAGLMAENAGQDAGFEGLVQKVIQALATSGYLAQGTGGITPTATAIGSPIASVGAKSPAPAHYPTQLARDHRATTVGILLNPPEPVAAATVGASTSAGPKGPDTRLLLKKLPTFKGGHNEDFFAWFYFLAYIPYALEGAARQWLAVQPSTARANATATMAALMDAYGHLTATRLDERIRQAKQGRDEYARDFWYRLKREADRMPGMFGESQLEGRWRAGLRTDLGLFMLQHTDLPFGDQLRKLHVYERELIQRKGITVGAVDAEQTNGSRVQRDSGEASGRPRQLGPCWLCEQHGHIRQLPEARPEVCSGRDRWRLEGTGAGKRMSAGGVGRPTDATRTRPATEEREEGAAKRSGAEDASGRSLRRSQATVQVAGVDGDNLSPLYTTVRVGETRLRVCINTGAGVSLITQDTVKQLGGGRIRPYKGPTVHGVGHELAILERLPSQ